LRATIHLPRIGCGLAGGKWESVEPLIREAMPDTGVFVYDLARRAPGPAVGCRS